MLLSAGTISAVEGLERFLAKACDGFFLSLRVELGPHRTPGMVTAYFSCTSIIGSLFQGLDH